MLFGGIAAAPAVPAVVEAAPVTPTFRTIARLKSQQTGNSDLAYELGRWLGRKKAQEFDNAYTRYWISKLPPCPTDKP